MGWRSQPENVQQQTFIVTAPTIGNKPAFRVPAMRQSGAAIASPHPVGSLVKRRRKLADVCLIGRIAIKIGRCGQGSGEQESRIDGGQFALPGPAARFDVQKMIKKAHVPGCIGLWPLRAFHQKPHSLAGDLCS